MGTDNRMCMTARPHASAHGREYYCIDMSAPSADPVAFLVADLFPGPSSSVSSTFYQYALPAGEDHMCMDFERRSGNRNYFTEMGCYQWSTGRFIISDLFVGSNKREYRGFVSGMFIYGCIPGQQKVCAMNLTTGNTTQMVVQHPANVGRSDRLNNEAFMVGDVILAPYDKQPENSIRMSVWVPSAGSDSNDLANGTGRERENSFVTASARIGGQRILFGLGNFFRGTEPNRAVVVDCSDP